MSLPEFEEVEQAMTGQKRMDGVEMFICPCCWREFNSKQGLANHRGGRRKQDTVFGCLIKKASL